jgi:hypothetical protein
LNGQWKLRKEEKEREKKTTRGGKGMHSVKYGANKKKTKFTGDRREKKKFTERGRRKKNVFLGYKGFDVSSLVRRAREEDKKN